MSGISDRVLSKQELRTLQGRSDLKGWERLGIHAGLLTAAGWLVAVDGLARGVSAGAGAGRAVRAGA
jgi:hypothetical protein